LAEVVDITSASKRRDNRQNGDRAQHRRLLSGLPYCQNRIRKPRALTNMNDVGYAAWLRLERLPHNVTVLEAEQYRKRNSSARYFRVKTRSLRDTLPFFFIMPTYSEEDLTTAIAAYCNSEYPSIRKCAYAFDIPLTTFSKRLSTRTSCSKSHKSQKILSTAKEGTLLKAITQSSKSGYPITLLLTRELAEEIRLSYFYLSSTPTSYPPISV